jgi:hypothetical protein
VLEGSLITMGGTVDALVVQIAVLTFPDDDV